MSAPAGLRETLSRVGVALVLHLRDRDQPIYGDVTGELDCEGTFVVEVWGGPTLTIDIADVRSATSPDLSFAEWRAIRAKQREEHEREGRIVSAPNRGNVGPHDEPKPESAERAAPRIPPPPLEYLPVRHTGGDFCDD